MHCPIVCAHYWLFIRGQYTKICTITRFARKKNSSSFHLNWSSKVLWFLMMNLNAGPSYVSLYIKEAAVKKLLWIDEEKIMLDEGAGHVQMFATNLIASSLSCDGPIKQVEPCERNRWRGLILTTEEISEIEDKGLALCWERRNLISDPLGCPPTLSLSFPFSRSLLS